MHGNGAKIGSVAVKQDVSIGIELIQRLEATARRAVETADQLEGTFSDILNPAVHSAEMEALDPVMPGYFGAMRQQINNLQVALDRINSVIHRSQL